MEDIKKEDIAPSADVNEEPEGDKKPEGEQDPLKQELDKVKQKRTQKEKLIYTRNRIEQQLREIGQEEGVESSPDTEDEETPVTVGMLKKIQAETATKTALQLADDIENESEKELVKYHINNTIRSTGNPQQDLRLAQAIVNAAKNKQILEQLAQKPKAKRSSSDGGGTPFKEEEPEFTPEEQNFMKSPFNLTKEQILSARKNQAEKEK